MSLKIIHHRLVQLSRSSPLIEFGKLTMTKSYEELEAELSKLLDISSKRIDLLNTIRQREGMKATPDEQLFLDPDKNPQNAVAALSDEVICLMLEAKSNKRKIKGNNYQPFLIHAGDIHDPRDISSANELNRKIDEHIANKEPFHYDFIIKTGDHCSPMQIDSNGEEVRMFYIDAGLCQRNDAYASSLKDYRLASMSSLKDKENPSFATIYIDEDGQYIVRDRNGKVTHGKLEGIELSDLSLKINNPRDYPKFKEEVLTFTSNQGHTPLNDLQGVDFYGYTKAGIQSNQTSCSVFSLQHLNNLSNLTASETPNIAVDKAIKLPAVFLKNIQSTSQLPEYYRDNQLRTVDKQGMIKLEDHIAQYSITVDVAAVGDKPKTEKIKNYAIDYKTHKYLEAARERLSELKANNVDINDAISARENCSGKNTSSVTADLGSSKTSTSIIPPDKATCIAHVKDCKRKLNDMVDHKSAHTDSVEKKQATESTASSIPSPLSTTPDLKPH